MSQQKKIQKPGFMIYMSWKSAMMRLSGAALKELLLAMFNHTETDETPQFKSDKAQLVWDLLHERMDYDTQQYEKKVEQRRGAANTRWDRKRAADEGRHPDRQSGRAVTSEQDDRNAGFLEDAGF